MIGFRNPYISVKKNEGEESIQTLALILLRQLLSAMPESVVAGEINRPTTMDDLF